MCQSRASPTLVRAVPTGAQPPVGTLRFANPTTFPYGPNLCECAFRFAGNAPTFGGNGTFPRWVAFSSRDSRIPWAPSSPQGLLPTEQAAAQLFRKCAATCNAGAWQRLICG